jgi:hypothetical protein
LYHRLMRRHQLTLSTFVRSFVLFVFELFRQRAPEQKKNSSLVYWYSCT